MDCFFKHFAFFPDLLILVNSLCLELFSWVRIFLGKCILKYSLFHHMLLGEFTCWVMGMSSWKDRLEVLNINFKGSVIANLQSK